MQHHSNLVMTTLKAMDILHLQVLGSLRKMESSIPQFLQGKQEFLDTLSIDQAMGDIEHVTKWMEAAAKEVASLKRNGT